jgi:membrane-associated protease RseP (regulator of RpoE activity)
LFEKLFAVRKAEGERTWSLVVSLGGNMKRLLAVLTVVGLLASCTSFSGYVRFYRPYYDAHTIPDAVLLSKGEEPKIYTSKDPGNDLIDVLSNHYALIGESNFNGPIESYDGIKAVCSDNGATLVLVASKYAYTQNVHGTMALPDTSTSRTSGSVSSGGYYGTYQGTTTSTGTSYVPYSYDVSRFDQTALYFVRITRKFKLGFAIDNLTSEMRSRLGQNHGAIVRVVYKDTPAFEANLMNGDVIVSVDGASVKDADQLDPVLAALPSAGTLHLVVLHNGSQRSIEINF